MDFNAVRAVRDLELPRELRSYKVQLLVLATCWETLGSKVFPSEATLGKWCGCSVSTMRTALHKLRDAGYITITLGVPPGGSKYLSNHYGIGPAIKDYMVQYIIKARENGETDRRQKLAPVIETAANFQPNHRQLLDKPPPEVA